MNCGTKRLLSAALAPALAACLAQAAAGACPVGPGEQARVRAPSTARSGPAARHVKQEEVVSFGGLGPVRVRAVEVPHALPRLDFSSPRTGRRLLSVPVGTSDPKSFVREPGNSLINPLVRFRVLRVASLPDPLILAVAVRPGGSDHGFEATVVGEAGGRLRVLTTGRPPLVSIQGGVFVGDLGGGRGPGFAAWSFIWEDGAHYDAHRYLVRLYPFDPARAAFGRATTWRTKGKHRRGADALAELGLPRYENLLDDFPAISDYRN